MFGLGTTELLIVGGVILLLFGAPKLPQLGGSMAAAIKNFKKGLNEDSTEDKIEDSKKNP